MQSQLGGGGDQRSSSLYFSLVKYLSTKSPTILEAEELGQSFSHSAKESSRY